MQNVRTCIGCKLSMDVSKYDSPASFVKSLITSRTKSCTDYELLELAKTGENMNLQKGELIGIIHKVLGELIEIGVIMYERGEGGTIRYKAKRIEDIGAQKRHLQKSTI